MDDVAVVAKSTYTPQDGFTDEWAHSLSNQEEVEIRTKSAKWHVSVTDDGHLALRITNLPGEAQPRAVILPISSNFLIVEAGDLMWATGKPR